MWLPPVILFPVHILDFYAKSRSLHAYVSVFSFKWSTFFLQYSPISSNGFVPLCIFPYFHRGWWHKTRGMGGLEWVSWRRCARCNFDAKYLLRQTQSQARCPLWFPVPQWTWVSSSSEYPGVWLCNRSFDPSVNPDCDVRNGFVQFCGHELTQSDGYE